MIKSVNLLYVSDGKAEHRSQAMGLYYAYKKRNPNKPIYFQEISIQDLSYFKLLGALFSFKLDIVEHIPDYIIAVGASTHVRTLLLSKIYPHAKSIILMKTTLPFALFDYHVIPLHEGEFKRKNVITTLGVLNPIFNQKRHYKNRILIVLGGNSNHHEWHDEVIFSQIFSIVYKYPQQDIIITTTHQTPSQFLDKIQKHFPIDLYPRIDYYAIEQTPAGWIFEQMQLAETIWVSEDNLTALFEALTSGAKVGLLEVNRITQNRVTRMLDQLLSKPQPLDLALFEADRVAQEIFKDEL